WERKAVIRASTSSWAQSFSGRYKVWSEARHFIYGRALTCGKNFSLGVGKNREPLHPDGAGQQSLEGPFKDKNPAYADDQGWQAHASSPLASQVCPDPHVPLHKGTVSPHG